MDYSSARLVTDLSGLEGLKAQARSDRSGAAREVARQFEGLLVQMMVKSMRQASLGDGLLDSSQSLFYRDLYDQQLTQGLSERGLGLADAILRQLGEAGEADPLSGRALEDYRAAALPALAPRAPRPAGADPHHSAPDEVPDLDSPESFVEALWPWAQETGRTLGVDPEALLAQAALETGWGRGMPWGTGGQESYNLFGIKADRRWDGDRVSVSTLEYEQGIAVRRKDAFRSYESFRDSFRDYADFLQNNPRYRDALESGGDARAYFTGLQKAGYATDPAYADKIMAVLESPQMRAALDARGARLASN